MRQYSCPPEGNSFPSDDHATASIIVSGIMAFGCILLFVMVVCAKGCA